MVGPVHAQQLIPMKIPILIYHNVASANKMATLPGNEQYYCLEWGKFEDQVRFLEKEGYATITLQDPESDAPKPIMLTFDDGLESHFDCYRLLRKHKFAGVFFVVTDFIGKPGHLTWDQIEEMHRQGMSIQSHTCSHPIMTALPADRLRHELEISRLVLESTLHQTIKAVSIPQGFANKDVTRMAVECGYRYVFTSNPGIARLGDGYAVDRLTVFNRITLPQFKRLARMSRIEILKQVWYKKLLAFPKALLGADNYHRIRTVLLQKLK